MYSTCLVSVAKWKLWDRIRRVMWVTGLMQLLTRLIFDDEFAVDASAVTFTLHILFHNTKQEEKWFRSPHTQESQVP